MKWRCFASVLKVARVLERSLSNGPGERFVVWVRGCPLRCAGCANEPFQAEQGALRVSPASLAARANALPGLRGVTLSGGEPLAQPEAVLAFLRRLEPRLDVLMFTGYSLAQARADPRRAAALAAVDLLAAGPYDRRRAGSPWEPSSCKTLHALSGRIGVREKPAASCELLLRPDGSLRATGFPPPGLRAALGGT